MHRFFLMLQILVLSVPGSIALAQTWSELHPGNGTAPLPRRSSSAIYDPVDHRMVIFGGRAQPFDANDIWAFDLASNSWEDLTPVSGPAPGGRFEADVIYDPVGHKVIVYNGQGIFTFYNDVWSFDLTSNTWTELTPTAPLPNFRYGSGVVFDPVARDLVSFAGFTSQGRFNDTWRFNVDSIQWTDVSPTTDPGRRCLHAAAYDSHEQKMLIYGGQRTGPLDDLWELDFDTNQWTELTPTAHPDGRIYPAMVYDPIARRALIFGGQTDSGKVNEVQAYWTRLGRFEQLPVTGPAPDPRHGSATIFIPSENRMVAFGGASSGLTNDVWSLDLSPPDQSTIRAGNVNGQAGPITSVLSVNGSFGVGTERRVDTTPTSPFTIDMDAPPAEPTAVQYVLYGWAGIPGDSSARPVPFGIGWIAMPTPLAGMTPPVIWNNFGAPGILGTSNLPSPLAPTEVFGRQAGLQATGDFFLQGLIRDRGAPKRRIAVTNGVWINSQ